VAAERELPKELIELLDTAEETYDYLTLERLRQLARSEPEWRHLTSELARLLRRAVAEELVLCDQRLRITSGGRLTPARLYRLNRRHPRLEAELG
jgi:hypothetical protein